MQVTAVRALRRFVSSLFWLAVPCRNSPVRVLPLQRLVEGCSGAGAFLFTGLRLTALLRAACARDS